AHGDLPVYDPRWHRLFVHGRALLDSVRDPELQQAVRSLLYRLGNVPLPLSDDSTWPNGGPGAFVRRLSAATGDDPSGTGHELLELLGELRSSEGGHPLWDKAA